MARKNAAELKAEERRGGLLKAATMFKGFRPAREVMTRVRAVPTRFVQFDHAVRVGGFPIERFSLVHGPSSHGKTTLVLGLVDSFLERDHLALYIDAERTTPMTWAEELMGKNAQHPGFFAIRPETYEATIGDVREFLNRLIALKEGGHLPPETSALVVVDSLRKLVPADLMKEILTAEKEVSEERLGRRKIITAGRDRSAQLKAKMNAAWMDELVPLLEKSGAAFIAIAREMQDPDANVFAKKFGTDYKVGGGSAIYYDASLDLRVTRVAWVGEGDGQNRKVYGERHRITVKKTKVAGKDDKVALAHFHSSNGTFTPPGFDRARDVLELARAFGVVKSPKKGWLTHGNVRWRGEHEAVLKLTQAKPLLRSIEAEVRAAFQDHRPQEQPEPKADEEEVEE
jgi:RecA/RadA recombinase